MTLPLRPKRGGFPRPFGCALFIRDFLLGKGPHDSTRINPEEGAPQAYICFNYKNALRRATAMDGAIRMEERQARRQNRRINPDNIEKLAEFYLIRLPYKAFSCRSHSFNTYFSNIKKLQWVEFTGKEEPSKFQDHYPPGQPRKYFRLTKKGKEASDADWANPHRALYGKKTESTH
jgi:hypothetical protein